MSVGRLGAEVLAVPLGSGWVYYGRLSSAGCGVQFAAYGRSGRQESGSLKIRLLPMRFAASASGDSGGRRGASLRGSAGHVDAVENSIDEVESAQQNAEDGVSDDMASLVIDNPGLLSGQGSGRGGAVASGLRDAETAGSGATGERTDADVMLAVAAGDEAGYTYLVNKYNRQIIHFLFRMVHNEAVAEELAQEVFLRVYRSRESYRAEAKFSTWLYRIATNLAVNHARDTKNERMAPTMELDAPDSESGSMPEVADDDPNIEQRMLREERMAAIRKHVTALPERQRMAVLMHKYQEMDYRQIGEVLKLSESATKSLLFRAYQTLRESLKEFV
jgi:RNA polymerase sigma-70 factor (ECF subfamily)